MNNRSFKWTRRVVTLFLFCSVFTGSSTDGGQEISPKPYSEIKQETELQNLIDSNDFEGALQRLTDFPEEASVLVQVKEFKDIVASHMALHAAFLVDIPAQLNDAKNEGPMLQPQLDLIISLLKANPKACAQKDLKKRSPLQLAMSSTKIAPRNVIEMIIAAYPPAIRARDSEERLPLHLAVSNPMTSIENIQTLLEAYPGAVDVQDEDEALPIHLAAWGGATPQAMSVIKLLHKQNPSNMGVSDGDSETVLSLMAKYGRTTEEAMEYVVNLESNAVLSDRDELEGNTILHFAVQSSRLNNNTIYVPVLKAHPDATKKINQIGQLPLHVALRDCCSSQQLIQDLLKTYPQGAKRLDGDGMLPLHHACQHGVSDISVLTNLVEAFPDSVKVPVILHGENKKIYPLHLAMRHPAEKGRYFDTQNDIIYHLLEKFPESSKVRDSQVGLYPFQIALLSRRPVKILKKLMAITPEALSESIEIVEKLGKKRSTTALHVFASVAPTYLSPAEIRDMVKSIFSYAPDCAVQKDGNGRLPLHDVWTTVTEYNPESRDAMVDLLLQINPHAAKVFDKKDKSPLSYAVFQRDLFGVQKLLPLYPEAAKKKALDDSFPLHQLCDLGAKGVFTENIDIIMDLLLEINPQAAFEVDQDGDLPLHKIAMSAGFDSIKRTTINKLIEANPEAANTTNSNDRQPLMVAVISATKSESDSNAEFWIGMIEALLQANPQSAARHAEGGKTALAKVLFDIESLNTNRRREDDPLLRILEMLYKLNPQSVLARDARNRTALHTIATLLGDMGGMTPDSWKEFAIQIMHDFPEVGVGVDNGQRTPLFLYTLYLGDTAVATRESQDARTTRYIDNIGELLHQFIVLNPDALDVVDEYDLTPLAQISNSRLATVRGSKRYNLSPIIKVMKRLLSRDASYWKLASRFELSLRNFKRNIEELDCISLSLTYKDIRNDLDSTLKELDVDLDPSIDQPSCKEDWNEVCQMCPELSEFLVTIDNDLSSLSTILDSRNTYLTGIKVDL